MTSREKIIETERQVRAIVAGNGSQFVCPFCGLLTLLGQAMCCYEASGVVNAVLDHIDFKIQVETVERVMNHLEGAQHSALVN